MFIKMPEFIEHDDLEVDEQLELSPMMKAMIESYADQVGYVLPEDRITKHDRFIIALRMDEAGIDPLFTMEILAGRRIGPRETEMIMLAYAYKCGTVGRRDFFMRFCTEADLLALL